MHDVRTLAEDQAFRAKLAEIIQSQGLSADELAFLVPDDFIDQPFAPLPDVSGLSETRFLAKYLPRDSTVAGRLGVSKPPKQGWKGTSQVNRAPAEYLARRYTTRDLMSVLGVSPSP